MLEQIVIKGASEHNLKNIDLTLPRNQLVVFTGVSGSGKSSLAFDTLYAEGQRRYVESLSAYARQFLGQMEKPRVDYIEGLSPAISIEQKSASKNPRSTVGTVTEIYDYLRILFARVGEQHCHICGRPVGSQSIDQIVGHITEHPEGTRMNILAPLVQNRKGEHKEELEKARQQGFVRVMINNVMRDLSEEIVLDKKSKHTIDVVVDRLVVKPGMETRLTESVEACLKLTEGMVKLDFVDEKHTELMSQNSSCPVCGISFPELTPQHFSFNSPIGACPECNGLGSRLEFDADKIIPNPDLSIEDGAIALTRSYADSSSWGGRIMTNLAKNFNFSLKTPWKDLAPEARDIILYGTKGKRFKVSWQSTNSEGHFMHRYEGLIPTLNRRFRQTMSEGMKQFYMEFLTEKPCPACGGHKLKPECLAVQVGGINIAQVTALTVQKSHDFFSGLELKGNAAVIAAEVFKEIKARLGFLLNVGLHYLTLDRKSPTLSGGESQRIRLASQIGSGLVGVMYILDEPSIGLHQRDNSKLLNMLLHLRNLGNSVFVVEHDEEMMRAADLLVDFGPRAGIYGGEVVACGTPTQVIKNKDSLTGAYLAGKMTIPLPQQRRQPGDKAILVSGAAQNNLKNITASIPLGILVCITGVSGSGKSSLINQILYPAIFNRLYKGHLPVGKHETIAGLEHIDKIIAIDQQPIGRTPRSNPVTYIKVFDDIRKLFAATPAAKMHGYDAGRFSFNIKGGRCEKCGGAGVVQVEMHFLPDIYVTCEVCGGKRYNNETLSVTYKGKNIHEVLNMDVQEALELFTNVPSIRKKLATLKEVGLDYIKLGQPSTTLSGGEAQRVKLAKELSRTDTGKTLYLLDEPTTGLHFDDINKLLGVLQKLVDAGNTVVVIEHNLDVIKTADWVLDLGPEGGDGGGTLVATGTPEDLMKVKSSYTGQYLAKHIKGVTQKPKKS